MISSAADALLLLKKWRDETASVKILITSEGAWMGLFGTVTAVDEAERLTVVDVQGPGGRFLLDLDGATFGYEDPSEAPDAIRERAEGKYLDLLTGRLANRMFFGIYRLKMTSTETDES